MGAYNVMNVVFCGARDLWPPPMFMNGVIILVMVNHYNTDVDTTGRLLVVCVGIKDGIASFTSLYD